MAKDRKAHAVRHCNYRDQDLPWIPLPRAEPAKEKRSPQELGLRETASTGLGLARFLRDRPGGDGTY